jgi:hypothetical protein
MKNFGFKNEQKIMNYLQNKDYSNLNNNFKKLISKSFCSYEGVIHCEQEGGINKSDLKIIINKEFHTYSIKSGKGNSVHQESIESFIKYLKKEHQLTALLETYLLRFIWADGSIDGSGKLKHRLSSKKFKNKYPYIIDAIQDYFNTISQTLIRRFIIEGVHAKSSAEFIYYGTEKKGTCCRSEEVLEWLTQQKSKATLHVGKLSFQAWNRNLKGKAKAEKKRGIIQIKWGGLKKDIKKIAKSNLGKQQEVNFTKELNRKKNQQQWKTLGLNPKLHYAIRVKYTKYGKLNQQKVWAKADAFIAKGMVPFEYLIKKDFFLDEDDMDKFNLIPIHKTGISIKQVHAHHYQIMKISPSTFKKLFGSNILPAGASLYYKKKKQLRYNKNILQGWGIKKEDFFRYYSHILHQEIHSITDPNCQKCLKKIKRYAKKEIKKQINQNQIIKEFLFFGKGNFEEPFTASYIYENGLFRKNSFIPFSITTGSGRSQGKYTLVLKPK